MQWFAPQWSSNMQSELLANIWATPRREHWAAIKWILRYLRGTSNMRLRFGSGNPKLEYYIDSGMSANVDTSRSMSKCHLLLEDQTHPKKIPLAPKVSRREGICFSEDPHKWKWIGHANEVVVSRDVECASIKGRIDEASYARVNGEFPNKLWH